MKIKGKCVLITGGAKRCGAEMVKLFAAEGAKVIIHCNASVDEAQILLAQLPGDGHKIIPADFSRDDEITKLVERAGKFDILINNASIFFRPGSPEDLNGGELYQQINFRAAQLLLEAWSAQELPEACAVNILDQAVLNPGNGAYWSSRHQLMLLTCELARTLGRKNFRVNAVAPGPVLPPYWKPDSKMEKTLPSLPLARPVDVVELAQTVKFLCDNDSITGAVIPVDCGQHLAVRHG